MPTEDPAKTVRYEIDLEARLARLVLSGPILLEDAIGTLRDMLADPRFDQGWDVLFDLTGAVADFGAAEIRSVRDFVEASQDVRARSRWAVVAPSDVNYGLVRMFEALSSDLDIRTRAFRSREEALAWLAEDRSQE